MAKVSIVIPVYNVEKYLEECMNTVLRQTLRDIEVICVNDGSTDRSGDILGEYVEKDDRVRLVVQENGGYGKAMNEGISRASGEYVGIVEPDDHVPLQMFEDLYRIAKEHSLDFVKADFYRFARDAKSGDMQMKYVALSKRKEDYNKVFDPSQTPEALKYVMNTRSGIYRREFLSEHGIRHNETPGASFQDNGFFFQTFVFGKRAMIIDRPYYRNRRDNPQSSVYNPAKVYCIDEEYAFIRRILEENGLWEKFRYMYWEELFGNYISTLHRIGDASKREYVKHMCKELHGAKDRGELKKEVFTAWMWKNLEFVMKDPEGYCRTTLSMGNREGEELQDSLEYLMGYETVRFAQRKAKGAFRLGERLLNMAELEIRSALHRE